MLHPHAEIRSSFRKLRSVRGCWPAHPECDRIWLEDDGQFQQGLAADGMSLHGEQPTLVAAEQDVFATEFIQQESDFGGLKLNDLHLTPMHPAAEDDKKKLPGLQNKVHGSPSAGV